jgi:dienelactone hydrolase
MAEKRSYIAGDGARSSRSGVRRRRGARALGGRLRGGSSALPSVVKNPFGYDCFRPLQVRSGSPVVVGPVKVQSLTYVAADGTSVPAQLAVPLGRRVRGCLMYQPGFGKAKETAAPLWPGAAKLGLAVFTIDLRGTGARANGQPTLSQTLTSSDLLASFLREDVVDLRRGLDYLEGQAFCHRDVGYLGTSLGAILGVLLSGQDTRIRATVLTSLGATWRATMFFSPAILPGVVNDPEAFKVALSELSPYDPARWIAKISPRPVMLLDAFGDRSVPPVVALDLAAAAGPPKTILLYRGGSDPFAGPQGASVAKRVAAFLTANLLKGGRHRCLLTSTQHLGGCAGSVEPHARCSPLR